MKEIVKKAAKEAVYIFAYTLFPVLGGLAVLYFYQP